MIAVKRHIPNILTCGNLLMGCLGIVEVFRGNILNVPILIWVACILDFFDGFAARILNVSSGIGKELDSLADMVTFGVLPSMLIFHLLEQSLPGSGFLPFLAFLLAIFSAIRLAKFNVDTRQTDSFIGLPTPANALFFSSFPIIIVKNTFNLGQVILQPAVLIGTTILFSYLLIAEIRLFSLKFKSFKWHENKLKYIFLLISLLLLVFVGIAAIPLIILLYLILSLLSNFSKNEV